MKNVMLAMMFIAGTCSAKPLTFQQTGAIATAESASYMAVRMYLLQLQCFEIGCKDSDASTVKTQQEETREQVVSAYRAAVTTNDGQPEIQAALKKVLAAQLNLIETAAATPGERKGQREQRIAKLQAQSAEALAALKAELALVE